MPGFYPKAPVFFNKRAVRATVARSGVRRAVGNARRLSRRRTAPDRMTRGSARTYNAWRKAVLRMQTLNADNHAPTP